jgi:endo-beta-N-acetylglucosaminidase D
MWLVVLLCDREIVRECLENYPCDQCFLNETQEAISKEMWNITRKHNSIKMRTLLVCDKMESFEQVSHQNVLDKINNDFIQDGSDQIQVSYLLIHLCSNLDVHHEYRALSCINS